MKTVQIADETFRELGEPSDISIPSVAFWFQTNIGTLNNLIITDYSIDSALNITPDIGEEEKDIFKLMYRIHYYTKSVKTNLEAAALDSVLEVSSDGATIRKASRNGIAQEYLKIKRDEEANLKTLVNAYKARLVSPLSIHGDDDLDNSNKTEHDYKRWR